MTPTWVKRRHQGWVTRRHMRAARRRNAAFAARYPLVVRHGPFTGMRYDRQSCDDVGDLIAKLLGTYEHELHTALERWVAERPAIVVDVGAAEGYYAVGLARELPDAQVVAYDIDPQARRRCNAMAAVNGVADRLELAGECTLDRLRTLPSSGVALFLDCEGCELALLRPDLVANLAGWTMIVELHHFVHAGIRETLLDRFADTHESTVIDARAAPVDAYGELEFLGARERRAAVSEFRPPGMQWLVLEPVGTAADAPASGGRAASDRS